MCGFFGMGGGSGGDFMIVEKILIAIGHVQPLQPYHSETFISEPSSEI